MGQPGKRKLAFRLLILSFLLSFLPFPSYALTVAEAEKEAFHTSVILTGENENGNIAFLMALIYEDGKPKDWGIPGGRVKDKLPFRTTRQAAADELYEETGAFPEFEPAKILPKLLLLPDDKVYIDESIPGKIGVYYFLDYEHISGLPKRIKEGWKDRVKNRTVVDFQEMQDWTLVTWDDIYQATEQGLVNRIAGLPLTTQVNKFDFTVLRNIEILYNKSVRKNETGTEIHDQEIEPITQPHHPNGVHTISSPD